MRKLALFVLGFSAAIFLCQYFLSGIIGIILGAAAAIIVTLSMFFRSRPAVMLRIVSFGVAAGVLWNCAYDMIFIEQARTLSGYEGNVTAIVEDYPQPTEYGSKVEIKIPFENKPDVRAVLYCYDGMKLCPGNIIKFNGELLSTAEKTENDYFAAKGILLFAYAESDVEVKGSVAYSQVRYFHKNTANAVKELISRVFPEDARAFMTAILTGDRSLLNEETYLLAVLSVSGAAHVVAVSGMHVAFLVSLLRMLFGKRPLANILCIPIVIFFMAMTGFSPSVVRAGVMQLILLLGMLMRQEYDNLTSLSVAMLILLAANPVSVKNGGLQLSFAATLGIILFSGKLNDILIASFDEGKRLGRLCRRRTGKRIVSFVCATAASSASALVFTIPLTAVMFGHVSLIAPIVNILMLWAVSFAFSVGVIVVLLGFIWPALAAAAAWIPTLLVMYIRGVVSLAAKLPLAAVYTTSVYIKVWIIFAYTEFLLFYTLDVRYKVLTFLISNFVVLGSSIFCTYYDADGGEVTVSVLDVGQGQSVLIRSEGEVAVIDCGGSLSENAGDIAANELASIGENEVDILILTHFHSDHANGAVELMRRVDVEKIIAPIPEEGDEYADCVLEFADDQGIEIVTVTYADLLLELGAADFIIMPPIGAHDENEQGLTVLCSSGNFDVLITGDMSADTERRLVEYADIPRIELLVVGHHGSKYSTSDELLEAARPEVAAISVGINSYGHPSDEVIERLEDIGADVFRTDRNGKVTVEVGKKENVDG